MRISVIIPTLNEASNITNLVDYLLRQGGEYVAEVIVADGGSQDDTVARAQAAGARVVQSTKPGRAIQLNDGARAATAEVLYFVHADTLPPASFAMDIQEALAVGWQMGCYRYRFNSDSFMLRFNAWFTRLPFLWCQGGDKTFFIPQSLFWALGGYPEQFIIMEEYEFLKRAMRQYPLLIMPKDAVVSARKYKANSWLKVQLANLLVFNGWRFGVNPHRLKRWYASLLDNK